jgi:hypothetical protein
MDFFAAAPELDSDLVFGAAEVDLVVVANCTMLGMLMLYRVNEGLTCNGIRGLRSAVWKSWSTRSESPPTDQLEYKNFMKALCERMSGWGMKSAPSGRCQWRSCKRWWLVALATEDPSGALLSGELDLERDVLLGVLLDLASSWRAELRVFKSRKHRKCLVLASPASSSASGA